MSVAGFGFRAGACVESLADALARALVQGRMLDAACASPGGAGRAVSRLAAPVDKARAPCLHALAERLALDIASVSPEGIVSATVLTRSARVLALRGTGSVAEAAALVAAGEGATLIGPRCISGDRLATCALARRAPAPESSS